MVITKKIILRQALLNNLKWILDSPLRFVINVFYCTLNGLVYGATVTRIVIFVYI